MSQKQAFMPSESSKETVGKKNWIKKIVMGSFLFFLIKGLIWLAIFFGLGASFL
jgi:hypothetical protein